MQKSLKIIICIVFVFFMLVSSVSAISLINATASSENIAPGENVTITINFTQPLGSYTVNVGYNSDLFEYVSSEGGTANDANSNVIVYYFDQTGGSNPRSSMSVTFKAKTSVSTTSVGTFSITAEGLANADATQQFDDITTPITKNVTITVNNTTNNESNNKANNNVSNNENTNKNVSNEKPTKLPKTGIDYSLVAVAVLSLLFIIYVVIRINKNAKSK